MVFVTPAHPLNILDYSASSIRMERQSQSIQVPESSRRECVHLISSIVAFIHPGSMGQCHNTLLESKVMPWTIAQNNNQQKQDYHTYQQPICDVPLLHLRFALCSRSQSLQPVDCIVRSPSFFTA